MRDLIEYMKLSFPINWVIKAETNGHVFIRDEGIDRGRGFSMAITTNLLGYEAAINFDDYASGLYKYVDKQLAENNHPIRKLFERKNNVSCTRHRNYVEELFKGGPLREDVWWLNIVYRHQNNERFVKEDFTELLLSFILSVFPYQLEAEEEGSPEEKYVTVFERSRINRSLCLSFHGFNCKACGISLREQYGHVARNFIHVHHLNPLAFAGQSKIDPLTDMVPLCPNCHGIAHLRTPPFSVEEIKNMIIKNNGKIYAQ